jgi:diadenylate cyclase
MNWTGLIQILIITAMLWMFYRTFIKNTSSEKMVHGLVSLGLLWLASFIMEWMRLNLLAGFLHWTAMILSLSLIVIFQPELRKFFALMGNVERIRDIFRRRGRAPGQYEQSADAIVTAAEYMAAHHIGCLIVFKAPLDFEAAENKGVKLDAIISTELLLTIFHNKTPLHDGAVIIEDDRIRYAGAILPLSTADANWKYGTRHRAALGMSEASKSAVLVISEERGDISITENGKITKYDDMKKLRARIERIIRK